jgi:hypothetical protein
MKPSSRDHQLGLASPLNYAANQSGNIKNPSKKEAGLDVSHQALVSREGRGENCFLDIPFHRMSAIWMFRQLSRGAGLAERVAALITGEFEPLGPVILIHFVRANLKTLLKVREPLLTPHSLDCRPRCRLRRIDTDQQFDILLSLGHFPYEPQ